MYAWRRLLSRVMAASLAVSLLPLISIQSAEAAVRNLTFPTAPGSVYARYQASDYNATTKVWADSSGNGYNTTGYRGAPILTTSTSGTGSLLTFPVVQGGTGDGLTFPSNVLPLNYTFISVARTAGTYGRVFSGNNSSVNWLSGFYGSGSGAPTFHGVWINPGQGSENPLATNWVVGTDQKDLYRSNGIQRSYTTGSTTNPQLFINDGWNTAERASWQVAEVIIYNSQLSAANIALVENYLMQKYGVSQYSDATPVYSDFTSEYSPIIGDLVGGSNVTSMCASGKIATGFSAYTGGGGGISQVRINCKAVDASGQTSGADDWSASGFGTDVAGSQVDQNCAANSGLVGLNLFQGTAWTANNPLGASYAYFVGAATPVCATLPTATSTTTLTKVGTAANTFGTSASCSSGAVVVGITGKIGSIDNSLGVVCAYILGASGTAISGVAEVGYTVSDTNTFSPRIPTVLSRWETSTALAGTYVAINGETTTSHVVTNSDKSNYLRFSRDLANFAETATLSSTGKLVYGSLSSSGSDISIPFGQKTTATFSGVLGSGGYSYALSSTPTGISINSVTGVLTVDSNTVKTSYNLTVTVTDSYGATSTKSTSISVTNGVVTGSLTLTGGVTTASYRSATTITASVSPAGKITFYQNGKAIIGCKNKAFTSNPTCSWKPSAHGQITLYARVTPTDTANYSAGNTPSLSVGVDARGNKR